MSKQTAWDIYRNGILVETVFFDSNMDEDSVRRALIRDGFPMTVVLVRPNRGERVKRWGRQKIR